MAKIKHLYFKQLLTLLGFSETSKNIFEGKIGSNKYFLSVDFNNESITST